MSTVIPQRDLRNHNAQIIDRVRNGELFTVTRNGEPVADLIPHVPDQKPPRYRSARDIPSRTRLSPSDAQAWLEDIEHMRAALDDTISDPWERSERDG